MHTYNSWFELAWCDLEMSKNARKTYDVMRWQVTHPRQLTGKKYIIYLPSFPDHSLQESILDRIYTCSRSTQVVARSIYTNKKLIRSLCAPTDIVTIGSCISAHMGGIDMWHISESGTVVLAVQRKNWHVTDLRTFGSSSFQKPPRRLQVAGRMYKLQSRRARQKYYSDQQAH